MKERPRKRNYGPPGAYSEWLSLTKHNEMLTMDFIAHDTVLAIVDTDE